MCIRNEGERRCAGCHQRYGNAYGLKKKKRILWNKVVQGRKLGKGCPLGNNAKRLQGVGTEEEEEEEVIFMQLARSGDVDRYLR